MKIKIETRGVDDVVIFGVVRVNGEQVPWWAPNSPVDQILRRKSLDVVIEGGGDLALPETALADLVAAYLNSAHSDH